MEKEDVVRNIIISGNDFKFKEINYVEFETAVKYYIDQLGSNQPEPAMPKIAEGCDHAGTMYKQYQIDRLGINGHDIHFGVNKCSRCGYEDYWQVDI